MNQIKKNGFVNVLIEYNNEKNVAAGCRSLGGYHLEFFQHIIWTAKSFLFARRLLDRKVIQKLSYGQQGRQQHLQKKYEGFEFEQGTYVIQYLKQ